MKHVSVVLLLTASLVTGQEFREEYRNVDVPGKLETTLSQILRRYFGAN